MDLLSSRTIDVTKLAMDGLMERQRAISANIANVTSPNYRRQEVSFENQLKEIVDKEELRDYMKERNSIKYNPTSIEQLTGIYEEKPKPLTTQQKAFLQGDNWGDFGPQVTTDNFSGTDQTGNNVELEKEIMDMSKAGTKYTMLATLEQRQFGILTSAIKGQ